MIFGIHVFLNNIWITGRHNHPDIIKDGPNDPSTFLNVPTSANGICPEEMPRSCKFL